MSLPRPSEGYPYHVELVQKRVWYGGFEYGKHYVKNGTKYWRCRQWTRGCGARLPTRFICGHEKTSKPMDNIVHSNHSDWRSNRLITLHWAQHIARRIYAEAGYPRIQSPIKWYITSIHKVIAVYQRFILWPVDKSAGIRLQAAKAHSIVSWSAIKLIFASLRFLYIRRVYALREVDQEAAPICWIDVRAVYEPQGQTILALPILEKRMSGSLRHVRDKRLSHDEQSIRRTHS